ncbi:MAG: crossover junction endodeoxyribonuclease RuvC [Candidatus Roizmanbacteria bacterium]|nr:crossover junction endodeoxyribonuclease RuvC [Candidatus Roizmanbacteria bacterium]
MSKKTHPHCIVGIDPGIGRTGYAFLQKDEEGVITPRAYGCIETSTKKTHEQRFHDIYDTLTALIKKYQPQAMAMEDIFMNKNQKTIISVGQAQGVLMLAAATYHLPVIHLTPPQIKMALTGYGHAEKGQVERMVMTYLNLETAPTLDDTSDAIACALACLYINPSLM